MTSRRWRLLTLLPLFPAMLFAGSLGGGFGVVELMLWFGLIVAWLLVFLAWGGKSSTGNHQDE